MTDSPAPLSALPSRTARILAFAAICLAGATGGLVGFALVDVQCEGSCALPEGVGILSGSSVAALGTAVVAVLVLRAVGEWRGTAERR